MTETIIHIQEDKDNYNFCFSNLTWKEALDFEAKSYNANDDGYYFNSELEKRLILTNKIKWIKNLHNDEFISCDDIFAKLKHKVVEKIWEEYYKNNYLTANEASFYYEAAKKYFNSDSKIFPTPSIVIEVGLMMNNMFTMTREECSKLSMKEFEIIQLVKSAKN